MAKKSRRVKRRQQVRLSPAQMVQPRVGEVAGISPVVAPTPANRVSTADDLREEYRYVLADLKRIGILAVAMLAVLITLALLLT